jgi:hypothetical protein
MRSSGEVIFLTVPLTLFLVISLLAITYRVISEE